jgi:putative endonuclease
MPSLLRWFLRGRDAERLAEAHLRAAGCEILARNVRTKSGEIDLVAREGATLVIVEVKRRRRFSSAFQAVSAAKKRRLLAAVREARSKLRLPRGLPLRFDVVAVVDGEPLRHVRGAFSSEASFLA